MNKKKNTLVWAVYTEGVAEATSYIVGTMHVRDERAFTFDASFYEKILACEVFATEFALDDAKESDVNESMYLQEGQSLKLLIPNKLYNALNQLLAKRVGMELSNFNHFKPIMITNLLTENILSNDRMFSLDETLWNFAKENGKILRGIETFEEQILVLKSMSLDDQIKGLKDLTKNFSQFRKQLIQMTKLYEKADITELYKAAKRSSKGGRKLLLYDRNVVMADRIEEMMKRNSVCAAIGAGHLAGKKGVLKLLKDKGFKVKPA